MRFVDKRSIVFGAVTTLFAVTSLAVGSLAQSDGRSRNNPYSPSPSSRIKPSAPSGSPVSNEVSFVMQKSGSPVSDDSRPATDLRPSIAQATYKIAKAAEIRSLPPTEVYKIGVGDVLFVSLRNSSQGSGYFTVRADGTIDYPLAGDNVVVADLTTDLAEDNISGGIKVFADPQVEVKVRQFGSHKITVSGMVENAGEKNLQREAMPLFTIRAEAVVNQKASRVTITRGPQQKAETYDLRDTKTDDVLVYAGNTLDFSSETGSANAVGSFFISGEIVSSGQKDLTNGLTLYQAVIVSGGTKGDPKKAVIRRKNEKGMFTVLEHNLRNIKDGKSMDPFLAPGDVIEIKN